ncbi:MAG TPA: hypothetical protein VM889_05210 [Candidatus Thermoplasmatota archaeon]|nr:hypothetical protein [Candidatus Thermoplasmatota archaeon]
MADDSMVSQVLKGGGLMDLVGGEALMTEALKDLLRDEVKRKMREELERNPEIKEELKEAVRLYFEAKVHETYASLKFAKASAKLGVQLMPQHLRDELGREFAQILEKEIGALLQKAL